MRPCSCTQLSSHLFLALLFKLILFSFQRDCAVWCSSHTEQEQMFTVNVHIKFVAMWRSRCSISLVHMNVHQVLPVRDLAWQKWVVAELAAVCGQHRKTNSFQNTEFENPLLCRKAVAGARPHKPSSLSSYYCNVGGRLAAAVPLTSDLCVDGWKMMRWDPFGELPNSSKLEYFLLKALPQTSFFGALHTPFKCPFPTVYIHHFPQWGVFSCFALQSL